MNYTLNQNQQNPKAVLQQAEMLYRKRRPQEAGRLLSGLLQRDPKNGPALHLMGLVLMAVNQPEQALECLAEATKFDKRNPELWFNYASILCARRKFKESEAAFKKLIKLKPNNPRATNGLGMALSGQERHKEAHDIYEKAVRQDERFVDAYNNLGLAKLNLDDPVGAVKVLKKALELDPESYSLWKNLGGAYQGGGDIDASIASFRKTLELRPGDLEALFNIAIVTLDAKRLDELKETLDELLNMDPKSGRTHYYYGDYCVEKKEFEAAMGHYQQAMDSGFSRNISRLQIGKLHSMLGQFDLAAECMKEMLKEDPSFSDALIELVRIRKYDSPDEAINQLEEMSLIPTLGDDSLRHIQFSLGKVCDDAGLYDKAFQHYQQGNRLKASHFSRDEFEDSINGLIEVFNQSLFAQKKSSVWNGSNPVFVLGMPRSGTTLTEQVLASHQLVYGGGEQPYFGRLVRRLKLHGVSGEQYPGCVNKMVPDDVLNLSSDYAAYLETIETDRQWIVDKMPQNFLYLGMISLLCPDAPIVHCRRSPMDNCVSIFFQDFRGDHPYAYDLENLGFYYKQYQRLMEHWKQVLPNPILDFDYEEMVNNPEQQTRRLIDFVGLEWDDNCLQPHKAKSTIKTASIWQARQPIYTKSVERWRNYEAHLGPLMQALGVS